MEVCAGFDGAMGVQRRKEKKQDATRDPGDGAQGTAVRENHIDNGQDGRFS